MRYALLSKYFRRYGSPVATPAVTRGLVFSGLIRRTAPFSCLLQDTKGCGGSSRTRIFKGFRECRKRRDSLIRSLQLVLFEWHDSEVKVCTIWFANENIYTKPHLGSVVHIIKYEGSFCANGEDIHGVHQPWRHASLADVLRCRITGCDKFGDVCAF
jgi:hypothetical protein